MALPKRLSQVSTKTSVIDEYVQEGYNMSHYRGLAEKVKGMCEELLKTLGVRAVVTCRAKARESLKTKLEKMDLDFKTRHEIERNIFDLSGVRIALYLPYQKHLVIEEIKKKFNVHMWNEKRGKAKDEFVCKRCKRTAGDLDNISCTGDPESLSMLNDLGDASSIVGETYNPVFAGYIADHAQVKLNEEAKGLDDWKPNHIVEIQIVSVLLHAWAEVEHDITYKEIKAEAGMEEKKILDSINGIIMSAELLLDQLHKTHVDRVDRFQRPFRDQWELSKFLSDYMAVLIDKEGEKTLDWKMLLGLLGAVNLNSRKTLKPMLKRLGFTIHTDKSNLVQLKQQYLDCPDNYRPFRLARHMYLPFNLMEQILSQISSECKSEARQRAMDNLRKETYQCHVLLSSFLWIRNLSWGESISSAVVEMNLDSKEKEALGWLFNAPKRKDILKNEPATSKIAMEINVMWDWFQRQQKGSFFSFAFEVSRMGAFGELPNDLPRLRITYGSEGTISAAELD
jgi:ppGpp synthetase/RelA/SpoT-type nucleotidyltranferase